MDELVSFIVLVTVSSVAAGLYKWFESNQKSRRLARLGERKDGYCLIR